jgi:3-methyladenine DNA glycosylase AlkD
VLAQKIRKEFEALANPVKAQLLAGFFKTGIGEYAQGDQFWGVMVPETRKIVKKYSAETGLADIGIILAKGRHEERLCALLMLVEKFKKGSEAEKKEIFDFYLAHTEHVNNWDLVDLSAPQIVGGYLDGKSKIILQRLAKSKNLWVRRIAILGTFWDIREGSCTLAFKISKMLLKDRHDLIHKAVGWMLRECGKNCGEKKLEEFLKANIRQMPRTTLRYAIERFPETKRRKYLKM